MAFRKANSRNVTEGVPLHIIANHKVLFGFGLAGLVGVLDINTDIVLSLLYEYLLQG
uniref:Uncharacterized protein n=1 Tax=Candidatus Kentrum sp. LPFa TaxID=2126335 RepID=A0A450XYH1_9GAMM|nr:MAG: hypothetical protein BECKLPF1236A_GA0070988_102312 [Candidatus Kentron sp. LPFa]VFK34344.1 MAG: hypothetical protein BECKLPF1236C_GA0070990_102622 [Candidatus Kentron sp. LPFa]